MKYAGMGAIAPNGENHGGLAARCLRYLATAALLLMVAGCKVVIVVPEGGRVVADNGMLCLAGETCEIDVSTTQFSRTFTAIAEPGYRFTGYTEANGHFCPGSNPNCFLSTAGFSGNPGLMSILASNLEFFLAPQFEAVDDRYDVAAWRALLGSLNSSTHRSDAFIFQTVPNTANCDPGVLSSAARERFLHTVNLIRKLHYLPPVEWADSFATEAQQSALVQLANNYLSHFPQPGDSCYSAAAAAGAGSSNLSYRSIQSDPAYYPLGWVNDNYNISSLMEAGHRRWVLYPSLGYTSYGQARGYSSMKVFGFGLPPAAPVPPELAYVAMPYREYPHAMVSMGSARTPWSISMVPPAGVSSNFDYFSQASVSVTHTASGSPLTVHSVHRDNRGYGLANFLSWMVDGWSHDVAYTVTISNVRKRDGSFETISYPVEIDFAELQ
ncbi:MAG: hypothetical protein KDI09_17435 [Halioglobus sp.]|nr:hypothetical protein [Halioglobus sp.]